jgi:hypothetical protein
MSAQHQAEAAGVPYDILTEADLTNVAELSQYSALRRASSTGKRRAVYG